MKVKKAISIIFYVLAVIFLLIYAWAELMPHLMLSETGRLFLLGGSCLFLYVGYGKTNTRKVLCTNIFVGKGRNTTNVETLLQEGDTSPIVWI